jgi:hypothetical protein
MSRKLYYSGKKRLEYVTRIDSGLDPEELGFPLLCHACESRFSENGEAEVLKQSSPSLVPRAPV